MYFETQIYFTIYFLQSPGVPRDHLELPQGPEGQTELPREHELPNTPSAAPGGPEPSRCPELHTGPPGSHGPSELPRPPRLPQAGPAPPDQPPPGTHPLAQAPFDLVLAVHERLHLGRAHGGASPLAPAAMATAPRTAHAHGTQRGPPGGAV